MLEFPFIVSAFVAGVLTFLAPCTLPLVPGYLSFISGVSAEEMQDVEKLKRARRNVILNGLMYMAGFSAVFIFFGVVVGFVGTALGPLRWWLARIGGAFVILFGLMMLGLFRMPAFALKEWRFKIPFFERGKPLSSLMLGAAFAFGWSPCIGPILASVLFLAATSTTVFQGAFLLFIFSMGLAVPFLLIAVGIGSAIKAAKHIAPLLNAVTIVGGIFLIFIGILLISGNFTLLISYGYRLFRFIEYERLLEYL